MTIWKDLGLRYVPYPGQKPLDKVNIPARFAAAFGKAKIEKRGNADYQSSKSSRVAARIQGSASGSIRSAVRSSRQKSPGRPLQVLP